MECVSNICTKNVLLQECNVLTISLTCDSLIWWIVLTNTLSKQSWGHLYSRIPRWIHGFIYDLHYIICPCFVSPYYTLDISRYDITWYCTQQNNFEGKTSPTLRTSANTPIPRPNRRAMAVFCELCRERWAPDIESLLYIPTLHTLTESVLDLTIIYAMK